MKLFFILGAINAMLAVGLGAFGAHGLEGKFLKSILRYGIKGSISDVPCHWPVYCRLSGR